MTKQRTKEEMRAYQQMRRSNVTPVVTPSPNLVTPVVTPSSLVTPVVTPTNNISALIYRAKTHKTTLTPSPKDTVTGTPWTMRDGSPGDPGVGPLGRAWRNVSCHIISDYCAALSLHVDATYMEMK